MKNKVTALFTALLCLGLIQTACAPQNETQPATRLTPGAFDHLSPEEKVAMSQVLVDEAEEKARLSTLPEAFGLASEAVKLDKENYRAQLWTHIFQSILEFKGILARVRPLYMKQKDGASRYADLLEAFNRANAQNPDYIQFLTSGPNDIENDEGVRAWMDQTLVSVNELRHWIKANKDRELELNAPSDLFRSIMPKRCERSVLRSRGTQDGLPQCQPGRMFSFKLNRADYEILLSFVNLYTLQMSLFYAYRTHPLILFESDRSRRNPQEYIALLLDGQKNDLRAQHYMGLGIEIAQDWALASRQIVAAQAEYCINGLPNANSRAKGYLFSFGLCYIFRNRPSDEKNLAILDAIVAGRPLSMLSDGGDQIEFDANKFLSSPPAEISQFRPTKFDSCGNPQEFDESVLKGIVTKGSVNQFLRTVKQYRRTEDPRCVPNTESTLAVSQ